ncbi:MAG TPA: RnfH family protein [Oxalicibacterium sp.]|nr:RnfH family protein [Oxalicibacterium sp.]HWU99135.1 RnfH family protein [Oxalicibacterium sp.]
MADAPSTMTIQICYARADRQFLLTQSVAAGTTIQQAIQDSDLVRQAPEIDISVWRVGIFGKLKTLDTVLRERDRVEIYRPLIADPKDSRRRRAHKDAAEQKKTA